MDRGAFRRAKGATEEDDLVEWEVESYPSPSFASSK